jgi:hypothetical protein
MFVPGLPRNMLLPTRKSLVGAADRQSVERRFADSCASIAPAAFVAASSEIALNERKRHSGTFARHDEDHAMPRRSRLLSPAESAQRRFKPVELDLHHHGAELRPPTSTRRARYRPGRPLTVPSANSSEPRAIASRPEIGRNL